MTTYEAGTSSSRNWRTRQQQKDLVYVRDIPPLDATLSESSEQHRANQKAPEINQGFNKSKTLGIHRRPTPRYQGSDDYREDEDKTAQEVANQGDPPRDNFEEYTLGRLSSLTVNDDYGSKGGSVSVESRLDFSLGRLSSELSSGSRSRSPWNSLDVTTAHIDKAQLAVSIEPENADHVVAHCMLELTPRTNNGIAADTVEGLQNEAASKEDAVETITSPIQELLFSLSNSSSAVDRRWAELSAKYEREGIQLDLDPSKSNSSSDRHTILDVNGAGYLSPKSMNSQTFEDLLIEDCVETGLPSPNKKAGAKEEESMHFTFSGCSVNSSAKPPLTKSPQGDCGSKGEERTKPIGNSSVQEKEKMRTHVSLACSSSSDGSIYGSLNPADSQQQRTPKMGNQTTSQISPQKGLSWWQKNGKRLVEDKLGRLQHSTPGSRVGFVPNAQSAVNDNSSVRSSERPTKPQSDFDASSPASQTSGTSAFMRGLSVFEKKVAIPELRHSPHVAGSVKSKITLTGIRHNVKPKLDGKAISKEEIIDEQAPECGREKPRQEDSFSDDGASGLLSPRAKEHQKEDTGIRTSYPVQNVEPISACNDNGTLGPPSMKMMILAGYKQYDTIEAHASSSRSTSDDTDYAADILDVSSSLTHETNKKGDARDEKTLFCPTPVAVSLPRDEEETKTVELVMGVKNMASFDAKGCASSTGIPSWRIGQAESLSDFKLCIKSRTSGKVDEYHIHKHIIGVGPRSSRALENVFRTTTDPSTDISVVDEAADLLPSVLDYVYCDDYDLDLKTENVLAYRHLARLFLIPSILKQTAEFILKDIKIANMNIYVSQSSLFCDEVIKDLIGAKCGEEIENISISDALWLEMDPQLFLQVISCPRIDLKTTSRPLSLLVIKYFTLHKHELHAGFFYQMTSVSTLPLIDRAAAIPILEICDAYGAPEALQKLQKRCAHVMACNWTATSDEDRKRFFSLLRSLPSTFTVDFLEMVDSGKTVGLVDNALLKMLDNFRQRREAEVSYQGLESFGIAKLCGFDTNDDHAEHSLNWRMDASMSFSDWIIKIKHKETGKLDIYHIHKHVVSIGQYKGTFFADNFLGGGKAAKSKGNMTIELPAESAVLFSALLDFVYSSDHPLVPSTRTAPALRYLARVFGVYMLNKKVIEFLQKDMCLSNMIQYLDNADIYDDERIRTIAVNKCARDIRQIDPESKLMVRIPPSFFGRIVASGDIDKGASCHVNVLIAKYFTLHDLSEALLAELMAQVQMREIDQDSALQLLNVMGSVKNKSVSIFSDICQRCATIVVENWRDLRQENRDECFRVLRTLGDSSLVTDIFDAVEQDSHETLFETIAAQNRLVQRYRAQLADVESQRENDLARMKHEHETLVTELMKKQKYLESQVASFQNATDRRALRSSTGGFRYLSPSRRASTTPTARDDVSPPWEAASWTKMEWRGKGSGGGHAIDHDARVVDQSQYSQHQQQQRHSPLPEQARSSEQQQKYLPDLQGGQQEQQQGLQHEMYEEHAPPRLFEHLLPRMSDSSSRCHPQQYHRQAAEAASQVKSECESHASIFSQVFGCTVPEKSPYEEHPGNRPQQPDSLLSSFSTHHSASKHHNHDRNQHLPNRNSPNHHLFPPVAREHLEALRR